MGNKKAVVEGVREMSDEVAFLKWLAGSALAISGALTVMVWNDNKQRVEKLTDQLMKKADAEDVERIETQVHLKAYNKDLEKLSVGQERLFHLVDNIRDQIHAGNTAIINQVNMIHTDLIQKISQKQDRI